MRWVGPNSSAPWSPRACGVDAVVGCACARGARLRGWSFTRAPAPRRGQRASARAALTFPRAAVLAQSSVCARGACDVWAVCVFWCVLRACTGAAAVSAASRPLSPVRVRVAPQDSFALAFRRFATAPCSTGCCTCPSSSSSRRRAREAVSGGRAAARGCAPVGARSPPPSFGAHPARRPQVRVFRGLVRAAGVAHVTPGAVHASLSRRGPSIGLAAFMDEVDEIS